MDCGIEESAHFREKWRWGAGAAS